LPGGPWRACRVLRHDLRCATRFTASLRAKRRVYIPARPHGRNRGLERSMAGRTKPGRESTVDATEVARFSALAAEWWDARGKMAVLHRFNPVRLGFIKEAACRHFGRNDKQLDALAGLRLLDIGCGGGILSEPLARLQAEVVGADPSQANIEAAKLHAAEAGVAGEHRAAPAGGPSGAGGGVDNLVALGGGEAGAGVRAFVAGVLRVVKPDGLMSAATLNRTFKSFALGIVGAEYVLRWLPRGTHQWDKFVTPNELEAMLERHGLRVTDETGVIYDLLADRWRLSSDMDVNYMVVAERPPS